MPTPTATSMPGKGCQLLIGSPTSTLVDIGGVKSIKGPGTKIGTRDVTTLASTWKEFAPTLPDGGPVTASIMYDNTSATQTTIQGALATQPSTGNHFKIVLPTTTRFFTFNGIITGFDISGMDVEGTVMAELSIQVNGPIAFPITT